MGSSCAPFSLSDRQPHPLSMAFLSMSQLLIALLVAFVSVRLSTLGPRSHTDAVAYRMANGTLPTPLKQNDLIQQFAQQHFKGQIVAPEHFAFHPDGDIYFGVHDGRIMRTRADPLTGALSPAETVLHTGDPRLVDRGHPCGSEESEALCGRPLGMTFDATGEKLFVADCYLGLLEVDVRARTSRVVVREAAGTPIYFANSVAIFPGDNDTVYFTDSSSRWRRRDFIYEVMEARPTGRLIAYSRSTGAVRVLVTGVAFANGLLVDPVEGRYIILNELGRARLLRLDLDQIKSVKNGAAPIDWQVAEHQAPGALAVLIDNLPGIPDNLVWEEDRTSGRFWVGCGTARSRPFSLTDSLAPWPLLRDGLTWLLPKSAFLRMVPRVGLLLRLELDADHRSARIVESLQDRSGAYPLLTGAYEHRGFLYVGSISHDVDFVARIPWTAHNRSDATHLSNKT